MQQLRDCPRLISIENKLVVGLILFLAKNDNDGGGDVDDNGVGTGDSVDVINDAGTDARLISET